jgi:4-alpha-glucanotransferase
MRSNNFSWWRRRVDGVKTVFHIFRIDHVLGFYRIYTFPWRPKENEEFLPLDWHQMLERTAGRSPQFAPRDDTNWENAEANRREGEEYLRSILLECGATKLVGEDLGTVPDYVRPSLHSLGIAGFKIPQWEVRHGQLASGANYDRLSVATYATHDHKPIRALWEEAFEEASATSDQARQDVYRIADFANLSGLNPETDYDHEFYPAIMKALFDCNAWIAVVMITDLLGQRDRLNVPGTAADTNWTRRMRMSVTRLRSSRGAREKMRLIKRLLETTGRI